MRHLFVVLYLLVVQCTASLSRVKRDVLSHPDGNTYECDSSNSLQSSDSYINIARQNAFPGNINDSFSTCHFTSCSTPEGDWYWCPLNQVIVSSPGRQDTGCTIPLSDSVRDIYLPCYERAANATGLMCVPVFCSAAIQPALPTVTVAGISFSSIGSDTIVTAETDMTSAITHTSTFTTTPTSTITISPESGTVTYTSTTFSSTSTVVQTTTSFTGNTETSTVVASLVSLNTAVVAVELSNVVYDITSYATVSFAYMTSSMGGTETVYVTETAGPVTSTAVASVQGVVISTELEAAVATTMAILTVYTTMDPVTVTQFPDAGAAAINPDSVPSDSSSASSQEQPQQQQQSSSPTSTSATGTKHHGLSSGAIAGIVIGSLLAALLLFGLIFLCIRRRRQSRDNDNPEPDMIEVGTATTATATTLHRTSAPVLVINTPSLNSCRQSPSSIPIVLSPDDENITTPIVMHRSDERGSDGDVTPTPTPSLAQSHQDVYNVSHHRVVQHDVVPIMYNPHAASTTHPMEQYQQYQQYQEQPPPAAIASTNISHNVRQELSHLNTINVVEPERFTPSPNSDTRNPFSDKHSVDNLYEAQRLQMMKVGGTNSVGEVVIPHERANINEEDASRASSTMEFYDARQFD